MFRLSALDVPQQQAVQPHQVPLRPSDAISPGEENWDVMEVTQFRTALHPFEPVKNEGQLVRFQGGIDNEPGAVLQPGGREEKGSLSGGCWVARHNFLHCHGTYLVVQFPKQHFVLAPWALLASKL